MKEKTLNKHLIVALFLGLVFHGATIFFTLESTYDALIHLFFANHYAHNWFEPWSYKWYTGFTLLSYPPLVHQCIAILSLIGGLKFGLFSVAFICIILFITGVYRFSLLLTSNKTVAGYAAILAVFSSSFIETLHLFGQLPSIVGISLLMHALPEIYQWLKTGKYWYLYTSLALIAVTVTSHHVTPIFGMVFFIFPVIGLVIMDVSKEQITTEEKVTFRLFFKNFSKLFKRIIGFGILSLLTIIICILPYWINSKNNPITQVPIPHGSRDNFLDITSSGLVFFVIPWGILLFILPYIFYRYYSRRYIFFGLSITVLFILGTGGTTPIPRAVLGENAFNILTLDRFTLWASIMALPMFGEFVYRFAEGDIRKYMKKKYGSPYYRLVGGVLASSLLFMSIFTIGLGYFRPSQPQKIKMLPIVNFLNQDHHYQWRYLTLGFGDQMAWLSTQTRALTVDGNYHSARRLPELTSRPIERLENSKFKGMAGIGSLQQFLTVPEKYNLKYIFSNDKFYDPILYFCGWQRLSLLENGVMIWEKLNVPPLRSILPKNDVATWQKIMWGVVPLLTLIVAFILTIQAPFIYKRKAVSDYLKLKNTPVVFSKKIISIMLVWSITLLFIILYGFYLFYLKNDSQRTPQNVIMAYYNALDFKKFKKSYELIDPKSGKSIDQFMLEISITDGLLSSYAKLDALKASVIKQTDSIATVRVTTHWITSLEKIKNIAYKTVVKRNKKWFVKPDDVDLDLPPDQLYTTNTTVYFNQGRKRITTEQTVHEDILKQPVLEVISAKLVQYEDKFAIVGEVQNTDNIPADVVLKGFLYNDNSKLLASYNAKDQVKHKLMPKEVSSFKIDFEGTAWSKTKDSIPNTFNPDEFTPIELSEQPTLFNLQVAGNVSGTNLYKNIALNNVNVNNKTVTGTLFNNGVKEVTIPQIIISYYNKDKEIMWVDHLFLNESIRQERKQNFEYAFINNSPIKIISDDMQYCYVNGLANEKHPIKKKLFIFNKLQKINHPLYRYIKIETNGFIGNP